MAAAVAASAWVGSPAPANEQGDWWCIVSGDLNVGYCQGNPLPERLPLPEEAIDEAWDCIDALVPTSQGESGGLPDVPDICG